MILKDVFNLLNTNLKSMLIIYFLIVIVFGIVELVGIGSLVLFFNLLLSENIENSNAALQKLYTHFQFKNFSDFLFLMGVFTISSVVVRNLLLILDSYYRTKFAYILQAYLMQKIFNNYLKKNYSFFLKYSSNQLSKNIIEEIPAITGRSIITMLSIICDSIIIFFLISLIFIFETKSIIVSLLLVTVYYFVFFQNIKKKINFIGTKRFGATEKIFEIIRESIEGVKEVKIYNFLNLLELKLSSFLKTYTRIFIKFNLFRILPKQILEIGIVFFVVVFILSFHNTGISKIISTLSILILTLYRILPRFDSCMHNFLSLKFDKKTFRIIISHLKLTRKENDYNLKFFKKIKIKSLAFSYKNEKNLLGPINLDIIKGDIIGITGKNGSGKSTLIELICGFLKPQKGNIFLDGQPLKHNLYPIISYVTQKPFFFNSSIQENITFCKSKKEIRFNDYKFALSLSGTKNFINQKKGRDEFVILDNAKNLSGGQKQKIAIARALYKNSDIIILDEATNALDKKSETELFSNIKKINLNKVFLIISHSKDVLNFCNKKFILKDGKLEEIK